MLMSLERSAAVTKDLLATAMEVYPACERPKEFAEIVYELSKHMGAQLRLVAEPMPNQAKSDLKTDKEHREYICFKKNMYTAHWYDAALKLERDEKIWGTAPYRLSDELRMPIPMWLQGLATVVPEAFNGQLEHEAQALVMAVDKREQPSYTYKPVMKEYIDSTNDLELQGMFMATVVPQNLGRNKSNRTPARKLQTITNFIARDPRRERHAKLMVENRLRSHQVDVAVQCTMLGLAGLRETPYIDDTRYFREVFESTREQAISLYRSIVTDEQELTTEHCKVIADSFLDVLCREITPQNDTEAKLLAKAKAGFERVTFEQETDEHFYARRSEEYRRAVAYLQTLLEEKYWDKLRGHQAISHREVAEKFVHAADYIAHPTPAVPLKVRDIVDAPRCKEELESARRMHNPAALGAKESEIVWRVFSEVMRFEHSHTGTEKTGANPHCWTPRYVREEGRVNCFTGPWLIAALLLECGIPEDQIFYCDVQGPTNDVLLGTHGSLIVTLASGQQLLIDVGGHTIQTFPLSLYDEATNRKLHRLFEYKTYKTQTHGLLPVKAEQPHEQMQVTRIHRDMHVMPMRNGFAWGALMSTGLEALETGKAAVARHAFELAYDLHPQSPDILCHMGRCHAAQGNNEEALFWMDEAIRSCSKNLITRYERAKLHIDMGSYEAALQDLVHITDIGIYWFGAKQQVEHAKELQKHVENVLSAQYMLARTKRI